MATRYLTALDYSDWHTDSVLRKHAKNRPLGQLEWRYQYTQRQPLLSCRTVHADASSGGGGSGAARRAAVRSASSSSLLPEQQKVLRQLLENGGRAVTSAPIRRSQGRNEGGQATSNSNAQTARRGRPSTSLSTSSGRSRPRSTSSSCRSHSTGRPKSSSSRSSESFMVLTVDKDMLRTRQTYHQLTDRIHAHWRPGSSDLNQGHYRRGQKCPEDVPMATDAWLTFRGAMGEGAEGVVDTFANFKNPDTYYNIGGTVGSRIAQQLRKGDRIRIGINGEVVSRDLRVKKWIKEEKDPDEEQAPMKEQEEKEEMEQEEEKIEEEEEVEEEEDTLEGVSESVQENPPSPASETEQEEFGELIVDAFDNLSDTLTEDNDEEVEEKAADIRKENITKVQDNQRPPDVPQRRPVPKAPFVDFPLNWDDQVTRPEVKVISPRRASSGDRKENLCETHPVVFHPHPSGRPPSRPRLASASPTHGYRIKQRPVSSSSSSSSNRHRHDSASTNKVRAITIDPNSEAEDQRLQEMSIEEVIQTRLEIAASTSPSPMQGTQSLSRSRSSLGSSHSPGRGGERGAGVARWSSASSPWQRSGREERSGGGPAALRSARSYPDRGGPHRATSSPSTRTPPIHPASEERRLGVPRPSSCVPVPGSARDVRDLGTMRPMVMSSRSTSSGAEPQGSGGRGPRPMTGLPQYRGPGSGGVSSIRSGGAVTGDAPHFIQISQPIRNPNTSRVPLVSGLRAFYYSPFAVNSMASSPVPPLLGFSSPPRSNTPEYMLQGKVVERGVDGESPAALPRPLTPSVHGEASFQSSPKPDLAPEEASATVQTGVPPSAGGAGEPPKEAVMPGSDSDILATPQAPVHVIQAISIPTGNEVEEEEEEEEGAETQRRERRTNQSDL